MLSGISFKCSDQKQQSHQIGCDGMKGNNTHHSKYLCQAYHTLLPLPSNRGRCFIKMPQMSEMAQEVRIGACLYKGTDYCNS